MTDYIGDNEWLGCTLMDHALGFRKMPAGYHLMLDPDDMYFFGVRACDGHETAYHWNKWAIYRWARDDARKQMAKEAMAKRGELWSTRRLDRPMADAPIAGTS